MKKLLYILVFFPMVLVGQTTTQNYVKTKTYKTATATSIPTPSLTQATESITYFDGLGRPVQLVMGKQSNSSKDIVTYMEYDRQSRQPREFLPYATTQNSLSFISGTTPRTETLAHYQSQYNDSLAYSEKRFEASPLNRILEQAAPGYDWSLKSPTKHTIRFDYQSNTSSGAFVAKLFKASATWNSSTAVFDISLTATGTTNYPADQLYVTVTKNENWVTGDGSKNTTEEFKDKEGRVVMKRTYGNSMVGTTTPTATDTWHETYYVYDQFGNLTYVIPPLADSTVTSTVLEDLCYQYRYDSRNRLVEKKLPGKQWEYIVYDKLDRVVATGPAFSPFTNPGTTGAIGWMVTKYDGLSRPILTAWLTSSTIDSAARKTLQDTQNSASSLSESKSGSDTTINGVAYHYTNAAWPTSGYHVLTVNYYDNYDSNLTFSPTISYSAILGQNLYNNTSGNRPIGLPTINWIRVLQASTDYNANRTFTLYDLKGRAVRTQTTNYLGGYTQIDNSIEPITGRINYTETKHRRLSSGSVLYVKDAFTYTNQERLLSHTHQIGVAGTPQLLAKNTYDELGQLISKQVGGTDTSTFVGLQKVDYNYNIRGWLTAINNVESLPESGHPDDLFAFKVNYNSVENEVNYNGKALYNGNISETFWRTGNDNTKRKYGYFYDDLNRLKNAVYQRPNNTVKVTNSYNESLTYDKNGNIKTLLRNGDFDDASLALEIDNLAYTYDASKLNRLMKVADSSGKPGGFRDSASNTTNDYSYDDNGNMTADNNKGITAITYNHLNLPVKITFGTNGSIEYLYDALGTKVLKKVTQGTTITVTDYLDGFQYTKVGTGNVLLDFFPHAEGYVKTTLVASKVEYNYVFRYADHLGNTRLTYSWANDLQSLVIHEENNYYPFGLKHKNYNILSQEYYNNPQYETVDLGVCTTCSYKYKYNGKEYQDELGLNMYDYGARNYDPAIGRWMNIDPKAEEYRRWTPYNYVMNNPMSFTDPDGMGVDWYLNEGTSDYEWHDGSAEKKGYSNLSEGTNRKEAITGGSNDGKNNFSLKPDGSFDLNGKSYDKGEKATMSNGIEIESNLNLKEKGLKFLSDIAAPFFETPQDIIFPIINQISVGINEGVHDGKAYNRNNVLLPNTYELNNWKVESGRSNQEVGNPTREEGQEIINNAISVVPSPISLPVNGLVKKTAANMATTAVVKGAAKKTIEKVE